ncbi:MAG TPA: DUF4255 domain-containing protein [Longimicrobiaceae bacterium]|nr:DUF4255 domain-containing protein [Longimicrobiaceae bacterium]
MSGFTVVSGVTRTLANVLTSVTGVDVEADRSPAENISDATSLILLYLYRVEQSPYFVNAEPPRPGPNQLREAPIGLNLFYLIAPYGNGQLQIQLTLGDIVRVFHDMPVIDPAFYHPTLQDTTEELRMVLNPLPMQEMTELWRSFNERSYRLALTYEASVVLIDSSVTRNVVRVEERHLVVSPW